MGSILGDPSFVATTNDIEKSTSAWHIPKRARNIYHSHMADRSCLKEGFGTFLSQIDGSTKLVDTAKRHYHVDETEEHQWRSSVHAVPEVDRHRHQTGKRPHDGSHPLQGQEYADLPRGRKNAPPQPNSIGDEMEVFRRASGLCETRQVTRSAPSTAHQMSLPRSPITIRKITSARATETTSRKQRSAIRHTALWSSRPSSDSSRSIS